MRNIHADLMRALGDDMAAIFGARTPNEEPETGCCDACGEPEDGCDCPTEYMREHDTGAER